MKNLKTRDKLNLILGILLLFLIVIYLNFKYKNDFYTELFLILAFFPLIILYQLIRVDLLKPLQKLAKFSDSIAEGDFNQKAEVQNSLEVNQLTGAILKIVENLKSASVFIEDMDKGNLDTDYILTNQEAQIQKKGLLASLYKMRSKILQIAEEEEERNWTTQGLAKFSDLLRIHTDNLKILGDNLLTNLVNYLNANQGGLFMLNEDHKEDIHLEMIACYAYHRKKFLQKKIYPQEGLIGQCFLEKKTIFLSKVPDRYSHILSGLGDAGPTSVVLVPLKNNEEIYGVLEIASFEKLKAYQIQFLEKLSENIASSVSNVKVNEITRRLLAESQHQGEEMRAQEEELRQNMEEMQATQEEMRRTQQQLMQKEANLQALINNTKDSIINLDRNYRVTLINEVLKKRYANTEYSSIDVGTYALETLNPSIREEWKAYYDRGLSGESFDFIIKSSVKGENSYRHYSINPVKDKKGEVVGVSIFSRDVTKEKQTEIEHKKLLEELSQKDKLFESVFMYFEFDLNEKIVKINELLLNQLSMKAEDVLGKKIDTILSNGHNLEELIKSIQEGSIKNHSISLKTKNKKAQTYNSLSTVIRDEEGKAEKYIIAFRDENT